MKHNMSPAQLAEWKKRQQALNSMVDAHAQGYHADLPREGCPECEEQFRGRNRR